MAYSQGGESHLLFYYWEDTCATNLPESTLQNAAAQLGVGNMRQSLQQDQLTTDSNHLFLNHLVTLYCIGPCHS